MNKKLIISSFLILIFSLSAYCQEDFIQMAEVEARYILQCQFMDSTDPAFGCINNIFGKEPTWVVPRENAMAILGLVMASEIFGNKEYFDRAQLAADYLVKVQDKDGAWFNQYSYCEPGDPQNPKNKEAWAKSPTQTAEVMIAFYKLGFSAKRYAAMKKAALYLIGCQKNGGDGYLLGGGKDADGNYRQWRWASDNSYAYQALKAAEIWGITKKDYKFSIFCSQGAKKILSGIDSTLYIKDTSNPDYGVWYRVVDSLNQPIAVEHHDWINYAPQMLDLPAYGVNNEIVGDWIHNNLQKEGGACIWDDDDFSTRKSPGFSFQAALCWRDLGESKYYFPALDWALNSGLWQTKVDENGSLGGWIDWVDEVKKERAGWWEKFIDTSFYAIAAFNGGYDFNPVPSFLRISYSNPKASSADSPCYLQFKFGQKEPE